MPAAYTHITLVNVLSRNMGNDADFPEESALAIGRHLKFCELGSVSPDYPYLALTLNIGNFGDATAWADAMHKTNTLDMVRTGVNDVRKITSDVVRHKCMAWLFGYSAHVATDVAVHPVVNLKAGEPYEQHKSDHRICEMHQDVNIFPRLGLDMQLSDFLKRHILGCGDPDDPHSLDLDISRIWLNMLGEVYAGEFASNPPQIRDWHRGFHRIMELATEAGNLIPFARHVAAAEGLAYPQQEEVDDQYTRGLSVPGGLYMDYDAIFEKTVEDVRKMWFMVARAIEGDGTQLANARNWSLDSGKYLDNGDFVFWGHA